MNKQVSIAQPQLHVSIKHDSAIKQVAGKADYIDDLPEPEGMCHAYLGLSTKPHADIVSMDLDAVRKAPGVVAVLTAADVPAENDVSSVHKHDEPVFASKRVVTWGQPLFAVIAKTRDAARRATKLAKVEYAELPFFTDVDGAIAAGGKVVTEPLKLERGDVEAGFAASPRRVKGQVRIGGQEHFYLESQAALAIPGEDNELTIHCSTQHPTEIQVIVAQVLGIPHAAITVNMRRMGGGFGGKETQGNLFASVAAIAAKKLGCAIKIRPDRDDDFQITGKRHDFLVDYDVGYDDDGKIQAVNATYAARSGYSADLSGPVTDRALFHADNAYWYPAVRVNSLPLFTNTVSNTAFRGFGGPQGIIGAERWIEDIAYALGKDPLEIRKANFYGTDTDNVTPYHQVVEDNVIHRVIEELEQTSDYSARRAAILEYNKTSPVLRKGIAMVPVKFGISFTATWHNQAGALIHVYRDGSIHLSHGGTEMGQGLHIKVAQVVADVFGVPVEHIQIMATNTGKVPNTSATAASSGTDLNGMAALDGATQIKDRMTAHAAFIYEVEPGEVHWEFGGVRVGAQFVPFAELATSCWMNRVQLSAAGFYKTPKIHWDRATGRGKPFYYYAYGAAAAEVTIDTLTGEYVVDRADVLEDVGRSLNPAIDIGQVEGGFIQGMGWLTTEELWWDQKGQLRTHAPSTYKIPLASDVPPIFNVRLAEWSVNKEPAIGRSKAVGEPPLVLGYSVVEAISMAVASVADYRIAPRLDMPATPERVLMGVERLKREAQG
ncbi:MAG: xanthine dehydrogenase molybdopterin binding subunit [Candidatus Devosia phytovorans]|uniref:Xanthine dehydrogenase molybdopterin binding subunit n=1 Tax=Candidatus Devosia phytovorans TaxID=3121372 RepID=A0AAJ5VX86_9HYPH|nr:xanthine dehydrogenase molybdopterin binding subunit [Devosia sp.]WEK05148.1 MAG: xanthine dehydrogenase molybdopterin binding subunit [Devosia sp.]